MKQLISLDTAFVLGISIILVSCFDTTKSERAEEVLNKAVAAHGTEGFGNKKISFTFRNKQYTAERTPAGYVYTGTYSDSTGRLIEDVLVNSSDFTRKINGREIALSEEWQKRHGNALNSVLYFVEILYRLKDPAVLKSYIGETHIKGQPYHTVKITFAAEQGGDDFRDEYRYWIHAEDFTLDYLAYNYETDGGGVRFREAFDREKIGGIMFQNYINFSPVPDNRDTPLGSLPKLFEENKLKEVSRIVNEDIGVR